MKELSLREDQLAALEVLKKVAEICEKEGFKYFLAYGTLIGAIRHKGFIPWDDDIDIWMPRPDYDKLLTYFDEHKEELQPLVAFNQNTCKSYPYMITRISDTRYWLDVSNEKDYGIGTFIDIYVLDGIGSDYEKAKEIAKKAKRYSSFLFQSTRESFQMGITKGFKKKLLKFPVYCYAKLRGKNYFISKLQDLVNKNTYENSKYIGCILWCVNVEREVMEKTWYLETKRQKFEDTEFKIPKDYNIILKQIYKDYMQMPPEKDRVPHHLYKTYEK